MKIVHRGEVYYVKLRGEGSEQDGERPVIIVQNDVGNKYSPTTIVVALTSRLGKHMLPTHVPITSCSNLKMSIALTEQIVTVDKKRLLEKVGRISENEMTKIDNALGISVDLIKRRKRVC